MSSKAILLLNNLLARLDADALSERPQFRGVVSDSEREAIRSLLEDQEAEAQSPPSSTEPAGRPLERSSASAQPSAIELKTDALRFDSSPAPDWLLGLDFGTAKSKAFAATYDDDPELLPLPIGEADDDIDSSVHEMSSSVWIDDDGVLFMGSKAVKQGTRSGDSARRRLDSLKQEISQVHPEEGYTQVGRKLPKEVDPTSTLTYMDAITFYLAYMTDLATTELDRDPRVGTRYVRRRFTVPWWKGDQRRWAGDLLRKGLIRAQLLADTFHGCWHNGIHVDQIKRAIMDATRHDERLAWLVPSEPADGVLEALAAASARVFNDRFARDVMLVVDVGAGTTDLSLFWVVQSAPANSQPPQFHRAWPIEPCGTAIKQAGDTLDSLLVAELMERADLGADEALRRRVRDTLYLNGVRLLKETLFQTGEITVELASDHIVTLTIDDFLNLPGIAIFEKQICDSIQRLLDGVHSSWEQATAANGITLVLTGGGSQLPMIRSLKDRSWAIGTRRVKCQLAPDLPGELEHRLSSEFIQEYPRLTVAMGGALKMLLDEKKTMPEWHGGAPPPSSLERFQITGV